MVLGRAYDDAVSDPASDSAPSWEQPKIVLGAPPPLDGEDPEPPMWVQPSEAAALVPVPAPPPASPRSRVSNVVFGSVPEPRLIIRSLGLWGGLALVGVVLHVSWLILLPACLGILTAVVNLIRWQRQRP